MNIAIGILIGGQSRRMGRPKALIPIGRKTLLEQTVATARLINSDILLLGEPPFDLPPSLASIPIIPDRHPGLGPIAGLEALLLARPETDVMLLACDMPKLSAALLVQLAVGAVECDAVVPSTPTDPPWHPCCAVYKQSCRPVVQEAIASGRRGMMDLFSRLRVRLLELGADEAHWVENWNEPKDLPQGPADQETP